MRHFYILAFFLTACADKQDQTHIEAPTKTEIKKEAPVKSFNNPALIYGTDFISFLAMLQVTQPDNHDTLLYYTSSVSKAKYSKEAIAEYYKKTNLNFKKKLKALRRLNDSTYILNYVGLEYATRNIKTYTVTVEKDTCKLIIKK